MSIDVKNLINNAIKKHQEGHFLDAEKLYNEVLEMESNNTNALNLLGLLKLQNNNIDSAINYIEHAININPCAYFYENLGRCHFKKQDYVSAIQNYKMALEFDSEYFNAYFNLGLSYKMMDKPNEAISYYQKALDINPNSVDILYNMAKIYESVDDTVSALECSKKAHELNPDDEAITYFLSICYLKLKNFENGWKYYESRPSKKYAIFTQALQYEEEMQKPLWMGEDIKDKTIFVYYEGGFGDSILFSRYLPILKEKCAKILFKPQYGIISLFKENNLGTEIIDGITPVEEVKFDVHIPIMSLPYALNQKIEESPLQNGYINANKTKVTEYREKYFNNRKIKIGIKWQGNPEYEQNRIIPLNAFTKLFNLPNTQFYSLQKDDGKKELKGIQEQNKIIDLGSTFNDFSDTAGAIENLDLVISNDTSVAHLAGAMGKKCWMLLPFSSNWRWFNDISYTPWYKSMKLFKQKHIDNWEEVFKDVHKQLVIDFAIDLNLI